MFHFVFLKHIKANYLVGLLSGYFQEIDRVTIVDTNTVLCETKRGSKDDILAKTLQIFLIVYAAGPGYEFRSFISEHV